MGGSKGEDTEKKGGGERLTAHNLFHDNVLLKHFQLV